MPESPMVGARVPQDWQQLFQALTTASGRKEAEVVREAHAQYLGRTDPGSVQGAIALPARPGSQPGAEAISYAAFGCKVKPGTHASKPGTAPVH